MAQNRYYSSVAQAAALTAGINSVVTTMTVNGTTGFPASVPYTLVIDAGTASQEAVTVTSVGGTTLTVTRGVDGTTAVAHDAGATVLHSHTARDFSEPQAHMAATTGVHGVTSALVGISDAQTLTNKDLTSGTNTFPSSLATDAEVTSAVSSGIAAHAALTATHGATGAVVGTTNSQTLTNKTVSIGSNTINGFPNSAFAVSNGSGVLIGSTKSIPGGQVVGDIDSQTLTNKTLTAPTVNGGTVAGATITSPTVSSWLQSGQSTVSVSASASGTLAVSFPVAFGSAPRVVVSCDSASIYVASTSGVTASGFTAVVRHIDNSPLTTTVPVTWFATLA